MILNVTEGQKQLIESQGYMVIQFKKWYRDVEPIITTFCNRIVDTVNLIITFLQDMAFKIAQAIEPVIKFGIEVMEKFKDDDDFYEIETVKYPFIRSIGHKYEPRYNNKVIYHRCRDRS